MSGREFEVIVWGATGYTGRLVAAHLLKTYGAGRRPDMGDGRAQRRQARRGEGRDRRAGEPAAVVADATDPASLDAMVRRADVVISTVGPYQLYGAPLVGGCARRGPTTST